MSVNKQAPNLRPPRVSILSSAEIIDIAGDRWWGGINSTSLSGDPSVGHVGWNPATASPGEGDVFVLPVCLDDETKNPFPRSGSATHVPFVIYATDDCTAQGSSDRNFIDRAKQKLAVNEAWTIERMLWDGDAAVPGNFSFVNSDLTPLDTGAHPLVGFAILDAAVAENRHDGRGMIHMTTKVFDLLQQYTLFRREGNIWLSPLDNIVVPGRGYSGNGPDDADETDTSSWMFGHPGIIEIVRSEVITFPEDEAAVVAQMDRTHNDLIVLAERVVAYIIQNQLDKDEDDTDVFSVSINPELATGGSGGGGGDATAANQATGNASLAALEDTLTADSATLSNVASSATNVTLIAANANRRGLMVHNDSTAILYIKFGATASTSSYSVKVAADTYWEMSMPIYQGQVDAIWASANGNARVTELT